MTVDRHEAAQAPCAGAALCAEAGQRRLVVRRRHRQGGPQRIRRRRSAAPDWPYGDRLLAEKFVAGLELTCAVIGDRALGVIDIRPVSEAFYGYDAKYAKGGSIHVLPAKIKPNIYHEVQKLTLAAHRALGCRGVSRADFRYDETKGESGELVCLEVNTQPGMTETSLVPEIAAHAGVSFGELVSWMVEDASCDR